MYGSRLALNSAAIVGLQLSAHAAQKRALTSFNLAGSEMAGDAPKHGLVVIGNPADPAANELSLMQMHFPAEFVEIQHVEHL